MKQTCIKKLNQNSIIENPSELERWNEYYFFAEYADMVDGTFESWILITNIFNAYHFTQRFTYKVNFAVADSLIFLRDLSTTIDILYLDSLDGNISG